MSDVDGLVLLKEIRNSDSVAAAWQLLRNALAAAEQRGREAGEIAMRELAAELVDARHYGDYNDPKMFGQTNVGYYERGIVAAIRALPLSADAKDKAAQ